MTTALLDQHGNPLGRTDVTPEQEATAQGKAREFRAALQGKRMILSADQLAGMQALNVRFEDEYKFPDKNAYFFTVNGVLRGRKIEGALFAGECILVFAQNVIAAKEIAVGGLRHTRDLLHEEYNSRRLREAQDIVQEGIVGGADAMGRRAGRGAPMALPMRKKMEAMVAHVFGGKPWHW